MDDLIFKSAMPSLPDDAEEGVVLLTFAEFNTPDHDGDTFLPGSIPHGKVLISAFHHGSSRLGGELPVGVADVWTDDKRAYAKAQYNLNTAAGRDHYQMIKQAPDVWEFSFGFNPKRATRGQKGKIFADTDHYEITQVIRGAGKRTGVLEVKSADQAFTTEEIAALKALVAPPPASEPEPETKEEDTEPEPTMPFSVDVLKAMALVTPREA